MKSTPQTQRCQPWLGTFVHIRVQSDDAAAAQIACDAAFERIAAIHKRMSFHDSQSDVSRLNKDASDRPVRVSPDTWRVLKKALHFSRLSGGVFDVSIAPALQESGHLPRGDQKRLVPSSANHLDIVLLEEGFVSFRKPLRIDLGGIAKGFAVDQAVETLRRRNMASGVVNAGGDIRVFGQTEWPVSLRHPSAPSTAAPFLMLRDGAVATSGAYFSRKKKNGAWASAIVDPGGGRSYLKKGSVTVVSATCMTADALTKIVALAPPAAAPLLERFRSNAFVAGADGTVRGMN
jgi:thiamine biosynthesis lipoprotein